MFVLNSHYHDARNDTQPKLQKGTACQSNFNVSGSRLWNRLPLDIPKRLLHNYVSATPRFKRILSVSCMLSLFKIYLGILKILNNQLCLQLCIIISFVYVSYDPCNGLRNSIEKKNSCATNK